MIKFDKPLDGRRKPVVQCSYVIPDVGRFIPLYTEYGMLKGGMPYSAQKAK